MARPLPRRAIFCAPISAISDGFYSSWTSSPVPFIRKRNSSIIGTLALHPIRSAPARTISRKASAVRMPPAALTFTRESTFLRISRTSSTVAPPVENPVEVFTNDGSTSLAILHNASFSSSDNRQFSNMTFDGTHASRQIETICSISFCIYAQLPALTSVRFTT